MSYDSPAQDRREEANQTLSSQAGVDQVQEVVGCPRCESQGKKIRLVALLTYSGASQRERVGSFCRECKLVLYVDGSAGRAYGLGEKIPPKDDPDFTRASVDMKGPTKTMEDIRKKSPRVYTRMLHYIAGAVLDADQYLVEAGGGKTAEGPEEE